VKHSLRVAGEKTIFFNSCDVSKSYSLSDLNMVTTLLLMFLQLAVMLTGMTGDALINVLWAGTRWRQSRIQLDNVTLLSLFCRKLTVASSFDFVEQQLLNHVMISHC